MKLLKINLGVKGFSHIEGITAVVIIAIIAGVGVHLLDVSHADTSQTASYTPMGKGYMCNPTPAKPNCSSGNYQSIYTGYVCRLTTTNSTGTHYWIKGYASIIAGPSFTSQTGAQLQFYKNSSESGNAYLGALPSAQSFTTQKTNTISIPYQPVDRIISKNGVPPGSIFIRFILQSSTNNFTPLPLTLNSVYDQYIKLVPC